MTILRNLLEERGIQSVEAGGMREMVEMVSEMVSGNFFRQ